MNTASYRDHNGKKHSFSVGGRVVYANGMIPRHNQRYPGFGDTGVIITITTDSSFWTNHPVLAVQFDRPGIKAQPHSITAFWPTDSLAGLVAGKLSTLAGGQKG